MANMFSKIFSIIPSTAPPPCECARRSRQSLNPEVGKICELIEGEVLPFLVSALAKSG